MTDAATSTNDLDEYDEALAELKARDFSLYRFIVYDASFSYSPMLILDYLDKYDPPTVLRIVKEIDHAH